MLPRLRSKREHRSPRPAPPRRPSFVNGSVAKAYWNAPNAPHCLSRLCLQNARSDPAPPRPAPPRRPTFIDGFVAKANIAQARAKLAADYLVKPVK